MPELRQRINVFHVPNESGQAPSKSSLVRYRARSIQPAVLRPIDPLPLPANAATTGAVRVELIFPFMNQHLM